MWWRLNTPWLPPKSRKGRWIQTFTGKQYWPIDPRPEDVDILDIGHHLSMICRYTGAVSRFYSVAEHSWHVSWLVPPHMALWGLLHDGEEAYLQDLARPLKHHWLLWGYRRVAARNWRAICQAFNLPLVLPHEVHEADAAMLTVERAALMKPMPWSRKYSGPSTPVTVMAWRPEVAERMFLERFYELAGG